MVILFTVTLTRIIVVIGLVGFVKLATICCSWINVPALFPWLEPSLLDIV